MTTKEKILAIEVLSGVLQNTFVPTFQYEDGQRIEPGADVFDEIDTTIIRNKVMELVRSLKVDDNGK